MITPMINNGKKEAINIAPHSKTQAPNRTPREISNVSPEFAVYPFNKGKLIAGSPVLPWVKSVITYLVPVVVTVDAGHGTATNTGATSWNCTNKPNAACVCPPQPNPTCPQQSYVEDDGNLAIANAAVSSLNGSNLETITLFVPRQANTGRATYARDNGADYFVCIHFNASNNEAAFGTGTYVSAFNNVNTNEDFIIARGVHNEVRNTVIAWLPNPTVNQVATHWDDLPMIRDTLYNIDANYHPLYSCLVEVEFITHIDSSNVFWDPLNGGANFIAVGAAISTAVEADARLKPRP